MSERQHHGAAAEGRLRPLRGLVHGGVHAGRREAARCRAVSGRNFQHLPLHFNHSVSRLERRESSHLSLSIQRGIFVLCQIRERAQGPDLEGLRGAHGQLGPKGQAICCQGELPADSSLISVSLDHLASIKSRHTAT